MISVLSQILHNNHHENICEETIYSLDKYSLTRDMREQWCAQIPQNNTHIYSCVPVPVPTSIASVEIKAESCELSHAVDCENNFVQPVVQRAPSAPETYTPTQENTLFWCVFIAHYGFTDYMKIGNKYTNAEIEEKQNMMETLSKSPRLLKETNHKLTNQLLQELYSALMVNKRDDLFTCIAFSVYYFLKIYVIFPHNNTYLLYVPPTNTEREEVPKPVFLYCKVGNRKNIYSLVSPTNESADIHATEIEAKYVRLENWNKPLKGASAYKLPELVDMANILGVDSSKTKKGELYDKIAEKCSLERVLQNSR